MLNFLLHIHQGHNSALKSMEDEGRSIRKSDSYTLLFDKENEGECYFENDKFIGIIHGYCYHQFTSTDFSQQKISANELIQRYANCNSSNSFFEQLRGAFIILIIDKQNHRFKIYADPLTIRTLYYYQYKGNILISTKKSDLLRFLSHNQIQLSVNRLAVIDLLLFDFVLDQQTIFKELHELDGGNLLTIEKGKMLITRIIDPQSELAPEQPAENGLKAVDRVKSSMKALVNSYVESPKDMSIALTGGFDSRSILSLLNVNVSEYDFFSYGLEGSMDIEIPKLIAQKLNLNYSPIYLEEKFKNSFAQNAEKAVLKGDGESRFNQANIAYVYSNFFAGKQSILTGLFGSELIKMPTSRGMFLDSNAIALLKTESPQSFISQKLDDIRENGFTDLLRQDIYDEYIDRILSNPIINNDKEYPQKLFGFLLHIGIRKYFRKEIKLTDNWIQNKFPFFDYQFLKDLLITSFPWVYNFSEKKNLVRNLKIHRLYSSMISENRTLSNITSTHGFRPKLLTHQFQLPILAWEYFNYRKKLNTKSSMNFINPMCWDIIQGNQNKLINDNPDLKRFIDSNKYSMKKKINFFSLQFWLVEHGYSI